MLDHDFLPLLEEYVTHSSLDIINRSKNVLISFRFSSDSQVKMGTVKYFTVNSYVNQRPKLFLYSSLYICLKTAKLRCDIVRWKVSVFLNVLIKLFHCKYRDFFTNLQSVNVIIEGTLENKWNFWEIYKRQLLFMHTVALRDRISARVSAKMPQTFSLIHYAAPDMINDQEFKSHVR